MTSGEPLAAVVIIGFLAATFWFAQTPAPSVVGDVPPDKSETAYHGIRPARAADGTLSLFDDTDRLVSQLHVRHNRVSFVPVPPVADADGTLHHYRSNYQRDVYLLDNELDLGTWAGYCTADAPRFQAGVRYAPYRALYSTLSLDLVASRDVAGAGVTFFPPAEYVGDAWSHLGVGAWYVAPYRGGHPGLCFGFSFSIHE